MNCAFDKEKLTGYYDGELEAAEKAEVERHIASCSECLRELGELKSAAILVKELPRLRAPKSIAEAVSREIQATGKVHQFAKVRRTVLWASVAAAALFIGLNVMYFSTAAKPREAPVAMSAPPPAPIAKVQQESRQEDAKKAGEKDSENALRRLSQDRAAADESKKPELRKSLEEQKYRGRDDARREAAPAERAVEKEKSAAPADAKSPEPKPAVAAAEPPAPAKPTAAPPPGAAPLGKAPAAPPPAPAAELAEKGAAPKENLARAESKRAMDPAATEAPATHLTLASTQVSRSRTEVEAALKKMGVPMPSPAPAAKSMKANPTPDPVIVLELTDSQIARLQQELNKPGASKVVSGAPDPVVLAEFGEGRLYGGKKEAAAGVASGGGAAKAKELGKADAKAEPAKDGKESKDADALTRGAAEAPPPADKSVEPRRKVLLHLVEVLYVPGTQPAPDALKK